MTSSTKQEVDNMLQRYSRRTKPQPYTPCMKFFLSHMNR